MFLWSGCGYVVVAKYVFLSLDKQNINHSITPYRWVIISVTTSLSVPRYINFFLWCEYSQRLLERYDNIQLY